ncbi:hypothetical protein BaRGS_00025500, partial [Batillaria attramentaria]
MDHEAAFDPPHTYFLLSLGHLNHHLHPPFPLHAHPPPALSSSSFQVGDPECWEFYWDFINGIKPGLGQVSFCLHHPPETRIFHHGRRIRDKVSSDDSLRRKLAMVNPRRTPSPCRPDHFTKSPPEGSLDRAVSDQRPISRGGGDSESRGRHVLTGSTWRLEVKGPRYETQTMGHCMTGSRQFLKG